MGKLRIVSIIILFISIVGLILWRFVQFPDWLVCVNGILMLISVFTTVFSSVKIAMSKK